MSMAAAIGMLAGGPKGIERGGTTRNEVYKGPDGIDRYHINDQYAAILPTMKDSSGRMQPGEYKLGDVMAHHEMFKRYPQFLDMKVRVDAEPKDYAKGLAAYMVQSGPDKGTLVINKSVMENFYRPDQLEKVLVATVLHEAQHGIQKDEGFAGGSSPNQMKEGLATLQKDSPETYNQKVAMIREYADDAIYKMSGRRFNSLPPAEQEKLLGDVAYYLLYGEQEARAVERQYHLGKSGKPEEHFDFKQAFVTKPDQMYAGVPADVAGSPKSAKGTFKASPEYQKAIEMVNQKLRALSKMPASAGSVPEIRGHGQEEFEDPTANPFDEEEWFQSFYK